MPGGKPMKAKLSLSAVSIEYLTIPMGPNPIMPALMLLSVLPSPL
jgi:hypothetical protein